MKIAVCVKQVPDAAAARRIDPASKRLDRSGEGALNAFDANAIEEALKLKEAAGDGEVVLVSLGPEKALDALRKGLAMGADRAVLVSDDAAAGSDLVATSRALAKALERESADLVLFGQQASDSDGAVPLGGRRRAAAPAADLAGRRAPRSTAARCAASARPSSATTRSRRRCPAVVAVSDAINEPRYPSLKGIMGAKKKPQEQLSLADLGVEADRAGEAGSTTEVLALGDPPPRGDARKIEDDGNAARGDRRLPRRRRGCCEDARLPRAPRRRAAEGRRSACSRRPRTLGGDVAGVVVGSGVRALAEQAGTFGAATVYVADDAALEAPLPQPRVDVLAQARRGDGGFDTVLFAQSVLAADVAAGLAARLDAGLNWDLVDLEERDGALVGKRAALADSVYVDVGWKVDAADRARPLRHLRPGRDGRRAAQVEDAAVELEDFSTQATMVEQAHAEQRRARRSRTPT